MKYLHPKKIWRNLVNTWHQWLFQMEAYKVGVNIEMGKDVRLRDCHIVCYNGACGGLLIIADGADLCGANFAYFGTNSLIRIGGGQNKCRKEDGGKFQVWSRLTDNSRRWIFIF